MKKVSVLIRSYNESKWILSCLKKLNEQTIKPDEICIIDNKSTDGTKTLINDKFKNIKVFDYKKKYLPGAMLNFGIKKTKNNYVLILSAHCIPANRHFIENLLLPLMEDANCCASYSRQIPLSFSDAATIRDLMLLYGSEDKIQKNDPFFNNASSMIKKNLWEKNKFDEKITNLEDRYWASQQIQNQKFIYYASKSLVYHHHGFHQNNSHSRLSNTNRTILRNQKNLSLKIGSLNVKKDDFLPIFFFKNINILRVKKIISEIKIHNFRKVVIFYEKNINGLSKKIKLIKREKKELNKDQYLSDVITFYKDKIIKNLEKTEYIIIFDDNFTKIQKNFMNKIYNIISTEFPDTIFPVIETRQPILKYQNNKLVRLDNYNFERTKFEPLYIAQRGNGTVIHVSNLFKDDKFSGKLSQIKII